MSGGDKGEFATWHIAADVLNGNVLVAENDPWSRFDLEILQGFALKLCELAYVALCILDVLLGSPVTLLP